MLKDNYAWSNCTCTLHTNSHATHTFAMFVSKCVLKLAGTEQPTFRVVCDFFESEKNSLSLWSINCICTFLNPVKHTTFSNFPIKNNTQTNGNYKCEEKRERETEEITAKLFTFLSTNTFNCSQTHTEHENCLK